MFSQGCLQRLRVAVTFFTHPLHLLSRIAHRDAPRINASSSKSQVSLLLISFESHRYAMLLEKRRCLKQGLPLFVCMRFQDLFHSPPGVLFAFPSRYWFTIGRSRVFSLGGWSPHLQTGFHVSRPTSRTLSSTTRLSHTGLSPTMAGLSRPLC